MIIGKLFLSAVDGFTFLGAQHLLTVGRPEGLAANLADFLAKGVLALFGKAFLLFFCLLMGFCTVSIAKSLPCAVRIKLLTALFADTLRVLMTIIRRPAFRLGFGSMCSIALTLSSFLALDFFLRFLLGFPSCFGNFLFGKWEVKLPDEVIINVHLLLSVRLFAHGFVNDDFINLSSALWAAYTS